MNQETLFDGAIVKSVSIDNMLNQRAAVISKVAHALDTLTEARELATSAGVGFPRLKIDEHRYSVYNMLDAGERHQVEENIRKIVDSQGWRHLMNESGLRSLMDAKAREQWDKDIEQGKFPAFTRDNITATFSDLHNARGDIFDRGVIAVFKSLSWCYKTNRPFGFGKRIILRYVTNPVSGGSGIGYTNSTKCDEVDDLVRVLSVLDGKPEPDHRHGTYGLVGTASRDPSRTVEHEYYALKLHRNGNGHMTFKRPDLVEKMNRILTKHYPGALAFDQYEATP